MALMGSISHLFRRFWPFLRDEIRTMFTKFHHFSYLPYHFSSLFVTLIPKVKSISHIGVFRPISLVWSLDKLLAKVLMGRLSGVMDNLISYNQPSFHKVSFLADIGILLCMSWWT